MIFRRRRVRIEIEENTLTLGLTKADPAAPISTETKDAADSLLLPPSTFEANPPLVAKGKSIPEGTRHVR